MSIQTDHDPNPAGRPAMLGPVQAHRADGAAVNVVCANGYLQITVLAADCVRVRAGLTGDLSKSGSPFSYAVAKTEWNPPPVAVEDDADDQIMIRAEGLACQVDKLDGSVRFADAEGRIRCPDDAEAGMVWQDGHVRLHKRITPDDAIYGLGQRASGLNLRGRRYALWNLDPVIYDRDDDPCYYSIPFYMAASEDGRTHGLFFDNTHRGAVDVAAANPDLVSFDFEGGELCYYFFAGPRPAQVIERYTELTGRIAMPPLWALGYHQCRWSYYPESKVREIAAGFRARRIPCDAIYLDIDYMDGFRCFTWDRERFSDPARLIADLGAGGFKTVVMIDPGIKVDEDYEVDQSGLAEDVFVKTPDGAPFVGPVWPGPCHFPDFTHPKARAWWGRQYDRLLALGMDGVWNDMNEPTVFTYDEDEGFGAGTLPDDARHDWEGRGAPHVAAHNVYGMQMVRASRAALERLRPGKRQLLITRSGYAGVQRYASSWTGDNRSTWDHLRLSISMTLNLGLCGVAFTGPDTGGFADAPTAEMVTRWVQLSACLPFFRMHSAQGTPDQEPWVYGQLYEDLNRRYIELRYELLPYIYTAFAQCAQSGMPIVRPIFMEDPAKQNLDDQFLLGDHLLVAPVLDEGESARTLYLPAGSAWIDFWNGTHFDGGQEIRTPASLDILPLFVRAGAALPMWPVMQYTGERPIEALRLRVFPGSGVSTVYEDAGDGDTDPAGWSTITVQEQGETLTVTWERHEDARPAYGKIDVTVVGASFAPGAVLVDGAPAPFEAEESGEIRVFGAPVFKTLRITRTG
ncbi:MAG: glycoside hydrolase family 31 protein [Anaerolineae bacterium]|nr:glycoside hydrolase family 31 protein [Anaerolineae bacterium]